MENNATIIALSGKGGVGKTSISAAIVKLLVEAHPDKKILAFSHGFFCRIMEAEIKGVTHRDVTLFGNCEIREFIV